MFNVIISALVVIVVILSIVLIVSWRLFDKYYKQYNNELKRYKSLYQLECLWRKWENERREFGFFLMRYSISTVAIYGMGRQGKLLYEALKKEGVEIRYAIDKKNIENKGGFLILSPESELPEVDLVIVTVLYEYNLIAQKMRRKLDCPIISLEQILL
jgi:hypothetical protein